MRGVTSSQPWPPLSRCGRGGGGGGKDEVGERGARTCFEVGVGGRGGGGGGLVERVRGSEARDKPGGQLGDSQSRVAVFPWLFR